MILLDQFLSQGDSIAVLRRQIRERQMTHALLITGEAGLGKWTLALAIAAELLAGQGSPSQMGESDPLRQVEALSHPDLIVVQKGQPLIPTRTATVIPVTDLEEVIRRVSLHGYETDQHVIIIRNAEDMTDAAQNKLLKTLEEPPEGTRFLLTCVNSGRLLPTIISRCRPLRLHPWGEKDVLRVLESHGFTGAQAQEAARVSEGSFGAALRLAGDQAYWEFRDRVIQDFLCCQSRSRIPVISSQWKDWRDQKDRKNEPEAIFTVLDQFVSGLLRAGLTGDEDALRAFPDTWRTFARKSGPEGYVRMKNAIELARRRELSHLSFQTIVEQLILSFMEAVVS